MPPRCSTWTSAYRRDRRGHPRRGARRALSRPRHLLPDRARRRAEAQGDLLHPRRGLCRRRDEARADRADRRAACRSSCWRRATTCSTRPPRNFEQVKARGGRVVLISDAAGRRAARRARPRASIDAAGGRSVRGADPLRDPGAAARLSRGGRQGHRRRPAAQSREERDGRVAPFDGLGRSVSRAVPPRSRQRRSSSCPSSHRRHAWPRRRRLRLPRSARGA